MSIFSEKNVVKNSIQSRHCDIFIAPSRYESFGLIYAEAMSFAKPVIGTKNRIPEVIDHEINGFLCENENSEDFLQQITDPIGKYRLKNSNGKKWQRKKQ